MSGAQDAVDEQTVFVENLPFDCTHEKLEAAFGDIGPVRECYVVGVPCRGVGFVKYALPTDARAAVELMAGRLVGGRKVRVSLSKQKGAAKRDRAAREPGGAPPAGGGGGARGGRGAAAAAPEGPRGRSRLIVRNLAWKVDEPALKALFSAHGRVVDVAIPRNADGRGRGFAFVEMSSAEESGDALKSLNLASLQGRPIAVDYAVAKDRYDGANAAPGADADAAAPPAAPVAPAAVVAAPAARGAGKATGKPAAVAQAAPTTDVSSDSTDSTSDEQDSDSEQQDSASEQQDSEPDSDGDEPDSADEDDDADSEPAAPPPAKAAAPAKPAAKLAAAPAAPAAPAAKPAAPAAKPAAPAKPKPAERASGTADGAANAKPARASKQNPAATVFVQNLSFDSTADELRDALSGAHGKVTSALLVTDGVTGLPRGSAFVNFASEAAAAAACAQSAAAAFGAEGEGTWLRGRQLRVLPAVDRTRASSLTEENAKQRLADKKESDSTHGKHADLASLGVIFANSDAAVGLPPAEVRKHEQDWAKKKAKLKSPHFVVCPTRLSVRNVPWALNEVSLGKLFLKAALDAVAAGECAGASAPPVLKHAKLVLEKNERAPLAAPAAGAAAAAAPAKAPRSAGFGFVEFAEHAHALAALHRLANLPPALALDGKPPPKRGLLVEFALDDTRKLELQNQRRERARSQARGGFGGYGERPPADDDADGAAKRQRAPRPSKDDRESRALKSAARGAGADDAAADRRPTPTPGGRGSGGRGDGRGGGGRGDGRGRGDAADAARGAGGRGGGRGAAAGGAPRAPAAVQPPLAAAPRAPPAAAAAPRAAKRPAPSALPAQAAAGPERGRKVAKAAAEAEESQFDRMVARHKQTLTPALVSSSLKQWMDE